MPLNGRYIKIKINVAVICLFSERQKAECQKIYIIKALLVWHMGNSILKLKKKLTV